MLRAKRDERLNFHLMSRHQPHSPSLCECGDEQNAFHPRELLADADTAPTAEREVRKLRP
jgi:hypothetical protein